MPLASTLVPPLTETDVAAEVVLALILVLVLVLALALALVLNDTPPPPDTCSTTTGARALLPDPESTHDDVTEVTTADGVMV